MDLDADGNIDILSGSYSRMEGGMAGLFQLLHGNDDGTFDQPSPLDGSDGERLILPMGGGEQDVVDRICTRPFACDLDGDGKLDIVAGNFRGTFGFFKGLGEGAFEPQATWLQAAGEAMEVPSHSDPFLIDWDGDGDLDLLSGSATGGAFLFRNDGSRTQPKFAARVTLLEPAGHHMPGGDAEVVFGDAHLKAPSSGTRVWAADVDGDGRLDLLIGDQITLQHLADGVDEATARKRLAAWNERQTELFELLQTGNDEAQEAFSKRYEQLQKEKQEFVVDEVTGFVWLLKQKLPQR